MIINAHVLKASQENLASFPLMPVTTILATKMKSADPMKEDMFALYEAVSTLVVDRLAKTAVFVRSPGPNNIVAFVHQDGSGIIVMWTIVTK